MTQDARQAAPGLGGVATILLATDLTVRCEAATDRALQLARMWGAKLHVLSVLSPTLLMDDDDEADRRQVDRATEQARKRLAGAPADIHVLIGPAETAILATAREVEADLIVTGPSGGEFLGQSLLGGTVKALMRAARAPVLLVKRPVGRAYRNVVVATDLSEASRTPIEVAGRFFGRGVPISIFHAFNAPYRAFVDDPGAYEASGRERATAEIRAALRAWSIPGADAMPIIAERGDVATRLGELAETHDFDLVATGTHGRSGLMGLMLGSVARAIAETVDRDILVVPSRGAWPG